MLISIQKFLGINPRTPARLLADEQAQIASNCPMFYGSLRAINDVSAPVYNFQNIAPMTIYRFGQTISSDTLYWFLFTGDVDLVRTPISGDTTERTYYSDGQFPKWTDNILALQGTGTRYPFNYRKLGVPAPTTPATVGVAGTATGTIIEDRVYIYTWVTDKGEESAPSPPSADVQVLTGQTVNLTNFDLLPTGNIVIRSCRIYRSTSGTYLFVQEITAAQSQVRPPAIVYNDNVLTTNLGEACPSLTWLPPPPDLIGFVLMPNGILAGFKNRDVYMCDPYHPFAFPIANINTVDYPIVGLGVMNNTLCVLTSGIPYWITGTDPLNMVVTKADLVQGCVSKRSIVSMLGSVIYASPDGLVSMNNNGSTILTLSIFTRAQWQALNPQNISAYQFETQYVAFFSTGGGFIYDFSTQTFMNHTINAIAGYQDLIKDTLYLANSNNAIVKWQQGNYMNYQWKSKRFTNPYAISFSCMKVIADNYVSPIQVIINSSSDGGYTNVYNFNVTSREPFRLPAYLILDFDITINSSVEIFSVSIATSMDEIARG